MTLEQFFADVTAVFNHPETVLPAAVAPQVEGIQQTIAAAGSTLVSQVESAALPAANAEINIVLDHNHLASVAPLVTSFFDAIASVYVASKTGGSVVLNTSGSTPPATASTASS